MYNDPLVAGKGWLDKYYLYQVPTNEIALEDVSNSYLHIFFQFVFQLIITPIPDYWGPVLGLR